MVASSAGGTHASCAIICCREGSKLTTPLSRLRPPACPPAHTAHSTQHTKQHTTHNTLRRWRSLLGESVRRPRWRRFAHGTRPKTSGISCWLATTRAQQTCFLLHRTRKSWGPAGARADSGHGVRPAAISHRQRERGRRGAAPRSRQSAGAGADTSSRSRAGCPRFSAQGSASRGQCWRPRTGTDTRG